MRAETIAKRALELFAAEHLLRTGEKLNASQTLRLFIETYRSDLVEKARQAIPPESDDK